MQGDDSLQMPLLRDRVIEFASDQLCVARSRLTDETTLFGDLGVDGDDGVELFEEFEKRFRVDLSEFDPAAHFGSEVGAGPLRLLWLLLDEFLWRPSLSPEERAALIPITIGDLVEAASAGRWRPHLDRGDSCLQTDSRQR